MQMDKGPNDKVSAYLSSSKWKGLLSKDLMDALSKGKVGESFDILNSVMNKHMDHSIDRLDGEEGRIQNGSIYYDDIIGKKRRFKLGDGPYDKIDIFVGADGRIRIENDEQRLRVKTGAFYDIGAVCVANDIQNIFGFSKAVKDAQLRIVFDGERLYIQGRKGITEYIGSTPLEVSNQAVIEGSDYSISTPIKGSIDVPLEWPSVGVVIDKGLWYEAPIGERQGIGDQLFAFNVSESGELSVRVGNKERLSGFNKIAQEPVYFKKGGTIPPLYWVEKKDNIPRQLRIIYTNDGNVLVQYIKNPTVHVGSSNILTDGVEHVSDNQYQSLYNDDRVYFKTSYLEGVICSALGYQFDKVRNEDGIVVGVDADDSLEMTVIDGIGGEGEGGSAAMSALSEQSIQSFGLDKPITAIIQKAMSSIEGENSGAVLTKAKLISCSAQDATFEIRSIGDTRAIAVGLTNAKVLFNTRDHSFVEENNITPDGYWENGEFVRDDGEYYEFKRNTVTRGVAGNDPSFRESGSADTYEITIKPGQILVLLSDGVTDNVTNEEIAAITQRHYRNGKFDYDGFMKELSDCCLYQMKGLDNLNNDSTKRLDGYSLYPKRDNISAGVIAFK